MFSQPDHQVFAIPLRRAVAQRRPHSTSGPCAASENKLTVLVMVYRFVAYVLLCCTVVLISVFLERSWCDAHDMGPMTWGEIFSTRSFFAPSSSRAALGWPSGKRQPLSLSEAAVRCRLAHPRACPGGAARSPPTPTRIIQMFECW